MEKGSNNLLLIPVCLSCTCHGVVALTKNLLNTTQMFVVICEFSSDLLEKYYGKLRMGSGGTYFITAQQVIEKTTIWKTKLLLKLRVQLPEMVVESGHVCTLCKYKLTKQQCELLDNIRQEENKLADDEKISLVYIAGYVTRKDLEVSEDTFFYYENYSSYTQHLDRGGLKHAKDLTYQWVIFVTVARWIGL